MPTNTDNLGLVKINPATDGNDTFNVETHLNGNWDKIDDDTVARQIENIGYGVQAGLETLASGTPDMNVHVQSGVVYMLSGKRVQFDTVTTIAVTAADATNPRKDIVYVSSAGAITYLAGTPDPAPVKPALPVGAFELCVIDVPAADTAIEQAQITDSRILKENLPAVKQQLVTHLADDVNPHNVTAAQTGALPTSGGTMTGQITSAKFGNANTLPGNDANLLSVSSDTGFYQTVSTDSNANGVSGTLIHIGRSNRPTQILTSYETGKMYVRAYSSTGWLAWKEVIVSEGGTMTGNLILNNNIRVRGLTTGGLQKDLVYVFTDDLVYFGQFQTNAQIFLGAAMVKNGIGSPEGVVTANVGSIYLRTDGASATTLYIKESGTGNTGWVAK